MASILDRHATGVMVRLNSGETFQAVSDWLADLGIPITRQSVHSCYSRKIKKIRLRDPNSAIAQAALARKTGQSGPIESLRNSHASKAKKSLDEFIEEGEEQLGTMERAGPRFIAKPKQACAPNPTAFSNMFARLSSGVKV